MAQCLSASDTVSDLTDLQFRGKLCLSKDLISLEIMPYRRESLTCELIPPIRMFQVNKNLRFLSLLQSEENDCCSNEAAAEDVEHTSTDTTS